MAKLNHNISVQVWDSWVYKTPEINYVACVLCFVGNKLWLVQENL